MTFLKTESALVGAGCVAVGVATGVEIFTGCDVAFAVDVFVPEEPPMWTI
jgi:uncharacterized oligopeptide transporter (OPT) family protein